MPMTAGPKLKPQKCTLLQQVSGWGCQTSHKNEPLLQLTFQSVAVRFEFLEPNPPLWFWFWVGSKPEGSYVDSSVQMWLKLAQISWTADCERFMSFEAKISKELLRVLEPSSHQPSSPESVFSPNTSLYVIEMDMNTAFSACPCCFFMVWGRT